MAVVGDGIEFAEGTVQVPAGITGQVADGTAVHSEDLQIIDPQVVIGLIFYRVNGNMNVVYAGDLFGYFEYQIVGVGGFDAGEGIGKVFAARVVAVKIADAVGDYLGIGLFLVRVSLLVVSSVKKLHIGGLCRAGVRGAAGPHLHDPGDIIFVSLPKNQAFFLSGLGAASREECQKTAQNRGEGQQTKFPDSLFACRHT